MDEQKDGPFDPPEGHIGHSEKYCCSRTLNTQGSCSKFGQIPPSGLGRDRVTDRGVYNIPIAKA